MFKSITKILGGDPARRVIAEHADLVARINALEPEMQALSDDALRAKTGEFRGRLGSGETIDDLLPEVFAVVREASVRTVGMRHFDVQLIGGAVLHQGRIAEMKTGEGKTLVATLPMVLNALEGKGVHLVTVNDYLARRDARWMGPIFHFLGMTVGVLQEAARTENGRKAFVFDPERISSQEDVHQLRIVERSLAYSADVTYGTNSEFGFDYLRDNMAHTIGARVQRGHNFAIVDEVDNILIDEARTPLIISGPSQEDPELYVQMAGVVKGLRPEDYEVSEKDRTVALTEAGEEHVERLLERPLRDPDRPEDVTPEQARLLGHLEQAMRAEHLFKRNKDYVVQSGRVIIVDEFTGRLMAGRRWSDGLHQAVEAKEGVRVREENVTYATITLQNYFRKYAKLGGMTGTAMTEAEEFNKIYKVDVTALPTNLEFMALQEGSDLVETEYRENGYKFSCFVHAGDAEKRPAFWRRKDYPDVVYRTEEAKLRAIATEITKRHVRGQPLLVGTASVELSERLSARLRAEPLQHLALCLILRDAYLGSKGMADEGLRIDELQPLYAPLDTLGPAVFRPFGKDLEIALNPARPENLERLARVLGLEPEHHARLAKVLQSGIPHEVLNAKEHDRESLIIAKAGAFGSVTIATNMAGRGVDIKLGGEILEEVLGLVNRVLRRAGVADAYNMTMGERLAALDRLGPETLGIYEEGVRQFREFMQGGDRVREAGGLHVLGSQRHEARRIDNQLRGRAARQGDPGSSQFFLSLEDELMRLFGGSQVSGIMQRLNIDDAVPIAHSLVDRTIEQSQTRVEGANFDTRKHLLEYDDVLNQQREVFYGQRNRVFTKEDLTEDLEEMLSVEVDRRVRAALGDEEGPWRLLAWLEETQPTINIDSPVPYPSFMLRAILGHLADVGDGPALLESLLEIARGSLEAQRERLARFVEEQVDRVARRIKDQVRQRVEAAETALEGARMEAEESGSSPDVRSIARSVEEATGIRLAFDGKNGEASDLADVIPEQIRAALEGGAWSALVQALERRVGESLGLDQPPQAPIDWDDANARLLESLDKLWARRVEVFVDQIRAELGPVLGPGTRVEEAAKVRLLVRMSYGQRTFFDPRTHQRRTAVVARLSYTYWAAHLIENADPKELAREILEHLGGAQESLRRSIGRAEITRLAALRFDEMDERLQGFLRGILGQEGFSEAAGLGSIGQLPDAAKSELADGLGRRLLAEFHRRVLLSVGDRLWVEYLTEMEALRTSIGLEAYGQRDPLVQYKSRAFDLFQTLLNNIRSGVVSALFRVAPASASRAQAAAPAPSRPERTPPADESRAPQPEAEDSEKKKRRRRRR